MHMRKLIYVFLLTIIYVEVRAQKQIEKFKGANTITVVTTIPADSLFMVFGKSLLDKNYIIIEKDNDFKTFRAKGNHAKYSFDMVLNIRVKDSSVVLRGNALTSGYTFEMLYFKGRNIQSIGFDAMDELARSMPGEVYYEKVK